MHALTAKSDVVGLTLACMTLGACSDRLISPPSGPPTPPPPTTVAVAYCSSGSG
jgi:hypothetical protein